MVHPIIINATILESPKKQELFKVQPRLTLAHRVPALQTYQVHHNLIFMLKAEPIVLLHWPCILRSEVTFGHIIGL